VAVRQYRAKAHPLLSKSLPSHRSKSYPASGVAEIVTVAPAS